MAVIDSLSILLKARTDRFKSGIKGAMRSLERFKNGAKKLGLILGGLSSIMVGLGSLRLSSIFRDAFKEADKVGKLSDELGLLVDQMFALEHAAVISGTSIEVITRGMQRMNRRIGEAALGYGEGAKGLEQLGIAVDDILGRNAFEQFGMIANAVKGMDTQAQKAAATYALFGRQGQFLLNTFELGSDGLEDMQRKSKRLLGTFNRDEFRIFEAMNDAVVDLRAAIKGFALKVGQEFAQLFGAGITQVTDLLVDIRQDVLPRMGQAVRNVAQRSLLWLQDMSGFLVSVGAAVVELTKSILKFGKHAASSFNVVIIALNDAVGSMVRLIGSMGMFGSISNVVAEDNRGAMDIMADGFDVINAGIKTIPKAWEFSLNSVATMLAAAGPRIAAFFDMFFAGAKKDAIRLFGILDSVVQVLTNMVSGALNAIVKNITQVWTSLYKLITQPPTTGPQRFLKNLEELQSGLLRNTKEGFQTAFGGKEIRDRLGKLWHESGKDYSKAMKQAEEEFEKSISLNEAFDLSFAAIASDFESLKTAFLENLTDVQRETTDYEARLQAILDKILKFKLEIPEKIKASKGIQDFTKAVMKLDQARIRGTQAAQEVLAQATVERVVQNAAPILQPIPDELNMEDNWREQIRLMNQLNSNFKSTPDLGVVYF